MKKILPVVIIFFLTVVINHSTNAQPPDPDGDPNNGGTELGGLGPCLQGGITFSSQAQLDSFKINFPTCNKIDGHVSIYGNDINNLDSLINITSIGGSLEISTDSLNDLEGLNNLEIIEGYLNINSNIILKNLDALDSLEEITGYLLISGNPVLNSISGLGNVSSESIDDLTITYNDSLSNCQAQSVCDYLSDPNGKILIAYNAPGCNNPPEIAHNCGITLPCLPYGMYIFYTQEQIDSFKVNYPECTQLEGDVRIRSSLDNLFGLDEVKVINGDLDIEYTNGLSELFGLDSLEYIAGSFNIWENALTSLNGLSELDSVGGNLWIKDNYNLTTLQGIDSLSQIGGSLTINGNSYLTLLTGLDNIEENSISNLTIMDNQQLSFCNIESICNYLADPNGEVTIENNAPGCNSQEEVEEACQVLINENIVNGSFNAYPNPFISSTTVKYELKHTGEVIISIFDHLGNQVESIRHHQDQGWHNITWNAKNQPPGVYYFLIRTSVGQIVSGKLVRMN